MLAKKIKTGRKQPQRLLSSPKIYRAKLDSKHRLVLRTAQYEYYTVYERDDGSLLITPQIITDAELSDDTLKMINSALKNMKRGIASKPIDLDSFLPKKNKK
jgi:hypothetical protein